MLQYAQHFIDSSAGVGEVDYARGEVGHLDELLDLTFVKQYGNILMVRFHPTDRTKANLVSFKDQRPTILAVLSGNIQPTANIPEFIPSPVVDVTPFVVPENWGPPPSLDDLFASGLVTKG
ncbi:hypothetical protein D3C71_1727420 [compost metagenome]